MRLRQALGGAVLLAATLGAPASAEAFCGFYVSGADAKLFNNATQVVLMRDGLRTVLSMQNDYEGPPSAFAMVVPVPVVLQEENVKTLPREIFAKVDQLAAPRLVEYWEVDPCYQEPEYDLMAPSVAEAGAQQKATRGAPGGYGVKIEAQFSVGEYEIVILSANDSSGLDRWLRDNQYKIPEGAEPVLRPYVAQNMKFFVAKVNTDKVEFQMVGGKRVAKLSPLRFHYDDDRFSLPVRLGLLNSGGTQDLIVHILAPNKRFEVANYPNVTIPTNLDLDESAKSQFGPFYAGLFDRTLEKNPKAVVTEYAWDAATCDPCPTPPLEPGDLASLGADVIPSRAEQTWGGPSFVLTRLHARYGRDTLGEDLVFREAPPIVGGREVYGEGKKLEHGSKVEQSGYNNFQGRYAIRHLWKGPIECKEPVRGRWGGPPAGSTSKVEPALDLAFAERGKTELAKLVVQDVPELGITGIGPGRADPVAHAKAARKSAQASGAEPDSGASAPAASSAPPTSTGSCSCELAPGARASLPGASGLAGFVGLLGLSLATRRRRRARAPR